MKPAQKWDFYKKEYKKTEVADECSTFENVEKPTVECASCGKIIETKSSFISIQYRVVDTLSGFLVCTECYENEMNEIVKNRRKQ